MHKYKDKFKQIALAILIGLIVFAVALSIFTSPQSILLGLIAFLVTLWTNEVLPLGVVSLLPILLFPSFDILTTKATTVNYSHPIIYLFLGGFLLAIAVEKTNLHRYIADKILGLFPNTPRGMIFSLTLSAGLLSSILSNTTTTLLLISIALFITDDIKLKMRFALAIAYGANVGGIMTPIGTPPNLILFGIMSDKGMEMIPFFQWIWMVFPLVIVMFIVVSLVLSYGVPNVAIHREKKKILLDTNQKKVLMVMGGLIALLLINAPMKPFWAGLGLSEAGILLGVGLMMFAPPFNILEWKEDAHKVPYQIMFLFGAGFSIAKAFGATGLADAVAAYLLVMTDLPPILLLLAVASLITFTTEITSNTALISIMLPVIYAVSEQAGINTTLFMMVATVCASYAFMLPIATAPNAIAMSSGAVHVTNMIRYGVILNLAGIFFIVLIAEFFWKTIL
ncbi:MAG: sodium-dependent dicarboxylate transporter 2/3/5 [Sulfurimonas sp.]|uniref:SLC13 family permease n=1 Tax=Sulfurimonas sp. TaxID=2022749 RepID=UPI0039E4700D